MFGKDWRRQLRTVVFVKFFFVFCGFTYFEFYGTKIFDDVGEDGALANLIIWLGGF